MAWCKLYTDIIGDAKLMSAARKGARHLVVMPWLLAWAKAHDPEDRGRLLLNGAPAEAADIAALLPGVTARSVGACLAELEAIGVLVRDAATGALGFVSWEARSGKPSDRPESVRERVHRHRERKRAADGEGNAMSRPDETRDGNAGNALRNAIEVEEEKEEEEEGEKERDTASASAAAAAGTVTVRGELLAYLPGDYIADVADLEARLPRRSGAWLRSLVALTNGMHGAPVPPADLGEAIRQFVANLGPDDRPSWKLFEGYVRRQVNGDPTPATPAGPRPRRGERAKPPEYAYGTPTTNAEDVKW